MKGIACVLTVAAVLLIAGCGQGNDSSDADSHAGDTPSVSESDNLGPTPDVNKPDAGK